MVQKIDRPEDALHPVVREFLHGTTPLITIARSVPEPRDAVTQAMFMLEECHQDKRPYEEVAACMQKLDLNTCDPSLHIILLDAWAIVANEHQRYDEVQALAKRAAGLVSKQTLPEVQALVRSMESFRVIVGGNLARREAKLKEALDLMPRESKRRADMLLNYTWSFATQGRLGEVGPDIAELRSYPDFATIARMVELVNRVETGQADGAMNVIAELGLPSSPIWTGWLLFRQRPAYRTVRAITAMLKGDSSLERAYRELGLADPQDSAYLGPEIKLDELPAWTAAMHHLLERRPAEALRHARRQASEWGEAMTRETGMASLNLLRAELACGHAEAARRLLELRREIGNVHYLDGLFLARLELLAGDRPGAARHFAEVMAAADRYGAHGRVDFELRMACELSPGDIAWLGRAAGALHSTRQAEAVAATQSPGRPAAAPAPGGYRLVGSSQGISEVRSSVEQLAALDVPVLVIGETGTGKELVARLLHESGPRSAKPFVAINCGAIAETLLESELFGHEKGAFTGAAQRHRGIFEAAGDGTVFLDEIGEISPRLQVMLLRVLETGEIRPVGASSGRRIACRVIAATNADLLGMVETRSFRKDLYYRLRRMEVRIPPLRERRQDAVELVEHFLAEGRADGRRPTVSPRLREWILSQEWPGNVRELRSFVERLRLLNSEKLEYDLADARTGEGSQPAPAAPAPISAPAPTPAPVAQQPAAPTPAATPSAPATDEAAFLAGGRSPLRRRDRVRALFARHGKLTRQELAALMGVSLDTAGRDLKLLAAEGLIGKVEPTASPRTHYFRLR